MNDKMIAVVSYIKQNEEGRISRVTEQYLIPGETFSTAEEFVYKEVMADNQVDVNLKSLKKEPLEGIINLSDPDCKWYKCTVETVDLEDKKIKLAFYVGNDSVQAATLVLENFLEDHYSAFEVKSVVETKIISVYENDSI